MEKYRYSTEVAKQTFMFGGKEKLIEYLDYKIMFDDYMKLIDARQPEGEDWFAEELADALIKEWEKE